MKTIAAKFSFAKEFNRPLSQANLEMFKIEARPDLQNYGALFFPDQFRFLNPTRTDSNLPSGKEKND
jgi:hypothetical protein